MKIRFNSGIIIHAVGEFGGREFFLSGNFPPTSMLVLL